MNLWSTNRCGTSILNRSVNIWRAYIMSNIKATGQQRSGSPNANELMLELTAAKWLDMWYIFCNQSELIKAGLTTGFRNSAGIKFRLQLRQYWYPFAMLIQKRHCFECLNLNLDWWTDKIVQMIKLYHPTIAYHREVVKMQWYQISCGWILTGEYGLDCVIHKSQAKALDKTCSYTPE